MKGTALLTNRQYYCMPTTTLHYTPRRTHNKMTYSISQDCCLHYLPRFATVSINIGCGGILQAIIPPIPKRMPTNVTGTQKHVGSAQNGAVGGHLARHFIPDHLFFTINF